MQPVSDPPATTPDSATPAWIINYTTLYHQTETKRKAQIALLFTYQK
jgi:hypothetical protein